MKNVDQNTITQAVLERMGEMPDARLKTIMTSLVHHLHDFARDVALSEEEWMQAIQFLTRTGQTCDDKRQEFILLSDVLGLSMLTVAMNNQKPAGCTEATVFGRRCGTWCAGQALYGIGAHCRHPRTAGCACPDRGVAGG